MTLHFEDLPVGWKRRVGSWTLERDEIVEIARRWEPQPYHVDEDAARASIHGGLIASSLHLFAIVTRLFFDAPFRIAVLSMLGKDGVRLLGPARPGDTLCYDTECIEARPSRSRPDRGVVRLRDTLVNQKGEPVLVQEVSLLVARRPVGDP